MTSSNTMKIAAAGLVLFMSGTSTTTTTSTTMFPTMLVMADDTAVSEPSATTTQEPAAPTPAPDCPLTCNNGGTCKVGEADYSSFPVEPNGATLPFLQQTSRDGWFCECGPLPSHTGLRCNRPYQICEIGVQDDPQSPIHMCFHGGKCLAQNNDTNIDASKRFCDCTDAQHNGIPYFGKYCEIEGAVQCAPGSDVFCVSEGVCKDDFETKAHPCECPEGHRGPHCEFLRGEVPDCTKQCQNGGKCTLGVKDFDVAQYAEFWSTHDENYQYCQCPENWFGESCETVGVECGNAHCFNGGACLQTLNANGESTYACDCRVANVDGKTWAGQYCEHEATTTCHPTKDTQTFNGKLFCTNGGECKDELESHLGCNCPMGRHGPLCEFNNPGDAAKCTLDCQNGGSCRIGHAESSALLESFGADLKHLNTSKSEVFAHCVCAEGFFGVQCEHQMEVCPGGQHLCLHGSRCIDDFDDPFDGDGAKASVNHKCDCGTAFNADEKYAGKFCQYSSTDICTKNPDPDASRSNFAFCVNNGICKARVEDNEPHPGCTCPDNFTGEHCEFVLGNEPTQDGKPPSTSLTTTNDSNEDKNNLFVGIAAAILVVAVLGGFFVLRALLCRGRGSKGTTSNEISAALSAEESRSASMSSKSVISNNGPKLFEDDSEEVEDYANSVENSSSYDEKDMSDVQIV